MTGWGGSRSCGRDGVGGWVARWGGGWVDRITAVPIDGVPQIDDASHITLGIPSVHRCFQLSRGLSVPLCPTLRMSILLPCNNFAL